MRKLLVCIVLVLFIGSGCAGILEGLHNLASDPNTSGALEKGAEGAAGVASFFGPIGALIGTGVLGGLAVWRKIKPGLAAATTKAEQYHAAAASVVTAIESFKQTNPDQWANLGMFIGDQLSKQGLDPLVIENVIRGLRGLPMKETT
ncbi:hypothetical protein IMZ48_26190 [Candidatus Bathyarchaeota archaeon]|nr:hypothetical protein [Candidatus Bathyarchaeota archaeon]